MGDLLRDLPVHDRLSFSRLDRSDRVRVDNIDYARTRAHTRACTPSYSVARTFGRAWDTARADEAAVVHAA